MGTDWMMTSIIHIKSTTRERQVTQQEKHRTGARLPMLKSQVLHLLCDFEVI